MLLVRSSGSDLLILELGCGCSEAGICALNAEGLLGQYTDGRPADRTAVNTPEPGVGAHPHEEPMATKASGTLILNLDQKHASWGLNCLGASVLDANAKRRLHTQEPLRPVLLGCS